MSALPFLIVSDIHLGAVPASTEVAFRKFLQHAREHSSGLLINGDLFDFWFEYRSVIPRAHYRVLAALRDVVEAGVPVSFVGGNHDAWADSFLRDEIGMTLLQGEAEMELAGLTCLVVHGDGVGAGDRGYRALRWTIRHPLIVGAFRVIHPDLGSWIASRVSTTEEKSAGMDAIRSRSSYIREWATERLLSRPDLDLVVAGHAHYPELLEVAAGRYYANAGDWIHNFSYLSLPGAGAPPRLLTWERE
ncbi:UDP-2,3-diacylglucosamine diphosphatase [soil metagenome]